jgi:hypothetical protein
MRRKLYILLAVIMAQAMGNATAYAEGDPMDMPDAQAIPIKDEGVYNVWVPENLDFVIDPFGVAKRGQVYSDVYEFVNLGDSDVLLKITDVDLSFSDSNDFEEASEAFGFELESEKKLIYLQLDFGAAPYGIVPITNVTGAAIDVLLPAGGGPVPLSVGGTVNAYADPEWRNGDVKINVTYRLEPAGGVPEALEERPTDLIEGEAPANSENQEAIEAEEPAKAAGETGETGDITRDDAYNGDGDTDTDEASASNDGTEPESDLPDTQEDDGSTQLIEEKEDQGNERKDGDGSAGQDGEYGKSDESGGENGIAD